MSTESLFTVGIAGAALVVSLVALYAQFFRKRLRLLGVMVDKPYQDRPDWFQYALINTGDVAVLVRKITCDSSRSTFLTKCGQVPSVVRPGEVQLFRVDFKPGEEEPAGVHFACIGGNGLVFEHTHVVSGSGHTLPGGDSRQWLLFTIVG